MRLGRKSFGESPCRSFGTTQRPEGFVAGQDAQASEAGGGGSGQQDGAHRLGAANEEGIQATALAAD